MACLDVAFSNKSQLFGLRFKFEVSDLNPGTIFHYIILLKYPPSIFGHLVKMIISVIKQRMA